MCNLPLVHTVRLSYVFVKLFQCNFARDATKRSCWLLVILLIYHGFKSTCYILLSGDLFTASVVARWLAYVVIRKGTHLTLHDPIFSVLKWHGAYHNVIKYRQIGIYDKRYCKWEEVRKFPGELHFQFLSFSDVQHEGILLTPVVQQGDLLHVGYLVVDQSHNSCVIIKLYDCVGINNFNMVKKKQSFYLCFTCMCYLFSSETLLF